METNSMGYLGIIGKQSIAGLPLELDCSAPLAETLSLPKFKCCKAHGAWQLHQATTAL